MHVRQSPLLLVLALTVGGVAALSQAQTAPTLAGRVQFQRTTDSPPLDHTTVRVTLTPIGRPDGTPVTTAINLDGTFALSAAPGTYALRVVLPPAFNRWWTQSATMGNRDLLDERIEVSPDTHLTGILLFFIERRPEVTGTLRTSAGTAVPDQTVIIFPVAEKLRESPRRIAWTKADAMGRYRFDDVPGGEYWIAIVDRFDPRDLGESIFFDVVAAFATRTTVSDLEHKRLDLTAK